MSKKKLAAIIVPCVIAIMVVTVLFIVKPWEGTPAANTYTLTVTVSPSGAGSVSPSGGEYESGVQITLTASPANSFIRWSGDTDTIANVNSASTTITMSGDYTITAEFGSTGGGDL